jgi:flagellar hook-length control protein FliK
MFGSTENMSDLIASLANNIMPPVSEPAVMETNPAGAKAASKPYQSQTFSTKDRQPVGTQDRRVVDNEKTDDIASGPEVTENKGENFREVLEKRLSDKSESQTSPEGEKKPEKTAETGHTADNPPADQKEPELTRFVDVDAQLAAKVLAENGKLAADLAQVKQAQGVSETGLDKDMPSHHIIVSLPGNRAGKAQIKANGIAAGQAYLLSKSKAEAAEAHSAKGQPVQSYPVNTNKAKDAIVQAKDGIVQAKDGIIQTLNKNSDAAVKKPMAKTDKPLISNNKAGTEQLQTQLKAPDDTAKKPASDVKQQLPQNENAAVLSEKLKSEVSLPTSRQSSPAEDLNSAEPPKKIDVAQLSAGQTKQNVTAQSQKQALSNNSKSTEQKTLDNPDKETSYTRAPNNPIVADTDTTAKLTTEFNAVPAKTQNIQPTVGTRGTAPANATGAANNGSTNTVDATDSLQLSPSEQIIQSIRVNLRTPEQEIYIGLNPPELGRIRIRFQHSNGEITGMLEVEKPQTKYDIEHSLPQIVASLQGCGVQVRRVEVVLKEQPQQNQSQSDTSDDFAGMEKQDFSGRTKDEIPGQPNSTPATAEDSVQQQPAKVVHEITDDTINVYV